MKAYDYVKEFGEGVDRMCRELASVGTKEPHYQLVAFIMKTTVYAAILASEIANTKGLQTELTEGLQTEFTEGLQTEFAEDLQEKKKRLTSRDQILNIIYQNNSITTTQIANILSISRQTVAKHIKKMQEQGILHRIGPDFGGHWEVTLQ